MDERDYKAMNIKKKTNITQWKIWIPADKKPPKEKDVLICTTDNYIGIGWYFEDSREWAFELNKEAGDHSGIVAYWCDLPALPKKAKRKY
jgi:hypothetical protein